MAKIHMILQGKGGVGKSFISSTLAQHKFAKGGNPLCIDTDPVNATFYGFKKLNVKQINVMNNDEIDPRKFDDLIELIAQAENDVIIDNGASTFVPMSHYLISNQIPALLLDMGHELVVHTVNEENIGETGFAIHNFITLCPAASKAVSGTVDRTQVRFRFNDHP